MVEGLFQFLAGCFLNDVNMSTTDSSIAIATSAKAN